MSYLNQRDHAVMAPDSLAGVPPMSNLQSPIPPNSISELEYAVRLGLCIRAMLNRRQAGKLPPHFFARAPRGHKQQVRYLLSDIDAFEQKKPQKTKSQKQKNRH